MIPINEIKAWSNVVPWIVDSDKVHLYSSETEAYFNSKTL
jgi:hypothetical protein